MEGFHSRHTVVVTREYFNKWDKWNSSSILWWQMLKILVKDLFVEKRNLFFFTECLLNN